MDLPIQILLLICLVVGSFQRSIVDAIRPPNFHNHTGCLYAYLGEASYHISLPDTTESQSGILNKFTYDKETKCAAPNKPGNLVILFSPVDDNNMNSLSIDFQIETSPAEGYWQVKKATLKIDPVNKQPYPSTVIEMKPVDIYAGQRFSYSCSSLVLENLYKTIGSPYFRLTLKHFQLQPFAELPSYVFAPSYDCSVWLTLPVIAGAILILFIIFTVMIGVYLLMEQGNQTSDLKFSKQGGMLMNQAQLDATKG